MEIVIFFLLIGWGLFLMKELIFGDGKGWWNL